MEVPEVKRLKSLEDGNARLKKLLAEAMLDKDALHAKEPSGVIGENPHSFLKII